MGFGVAPCVATAGTGCCSCWWSSGPVAAGAGDRVAAVGLLMGAVGLEGLSRPGVVGLAE